MHILLFALIYLASGHVSSCPDVNPLAFWMISGPRAQPPDPTVKTRVFAVYGNKIPTCNTIGRSFNGQTHLVAFTGANLTNTSLPGFLDGLPVTIDVTDPGNETDPLCFEWNVTQGYNVYIVAATAESYTSVYSYGPTPVTTGGPLCTAVPTNESNVVIALCYAPAVDVTFYGPILHDAWYEVAWNATVTPSSSLAVVCDQHLPPPLRSRYYKTFVVTANATRVFPTFRIVSGSFTVLGTDEADAVSAWVVSADGGNGTVLTPLTASCGPTGSGALNCSFGCPIDPELSPVSVVATARSPLAGTLDGVACASVPPETVWATRRSVYSLSLREEQLSAGVVSEFPTVLGPFDVRLAFESVPSDLQIAATIGFVDGMPDITVTASLTMTMVECL
jgi:hypothetical protein